MKPRAKVLLIKPTMTIRKVMEIIQAGPRTVDDAPGHVALAVNGADKLIGVVTDGDIRRALLAGVSLKDKIGPYINRHPITFKKSDTPEQILEKTFLELKMRSKKRLEIIIILDDDGTLYDVFSFFELWQKLEVKSRLISIIGLGYVGLTLALILAESGFKVVGVDKNKKIINNLSKKISHIHEPGINDLLGRHIGRNFFPCQKFKSGRSDIYIICVGTPVGDRGHVIKKSLFEALDYITNILKKDDLVILRSTVPIGTCRKLVIPYLEKKTSLLVGDDFYLSFAPERTVEGSALQELRTLPQVIGSYDQKSSNLTLKLFNSITSSTILVDNLETAEMIKLLNNSYRDLTFAFANEAALFADKLGLNSHKVITAANYGYDRSRIPRPSPGVGGYCLTKDPYIYINSAKSIGQQIFLSKISRRINDQMVGYVAEKVFAFIKENNLPARTKIFMMGVAFKGDPATDDTRSSTSLHILRKISKYYKNIKVHDPIVKKVNLKKLKLNYVSLEKGFEKSNIILLLSNHKDYASLNIFELLKKTKKPTLFFDAWHLYDEIIKEPLPGVVHRGV